MAILPLVIEPDERLHIKSEPVSEITDEIRTLLDDMLETMYSFHGVGLAAVQVGIHQRIIVIGVDWSSPRYSEDEEPQEATSGNPIKMINPEIIAESDEISTYNEGCLSFPDQYSDVKRPARVTVRYMDENGDTQTIEADDLMATCVQHEIDHCDGIVFTDHISKLKRDMIIRKLKKAKKLGTLPAQPVEAS